LRPLERDEFGLQITNLHGNVAHFNRIVVSIMAAEGAVLGKFSLNLCYVPQRVIIGEVCSAGIGCMFSLASSSLILAS
jgi:hypothetical protein